MDIVILNSGPEPATTVVDSTLYFRTIGAYKIAHACRQEGFSVQVIDHAMFFLEEELVEIMLRFVDEKTHILAISTTFLATLGKRHRNVINAIATVTKTFPQVKIIMGGYSHFVSKLITEFNTHAVITEYGEDIVRDVANHIIRKQTEPKFSIEFHSITNKMIKVYAEPLVKTHDIQSDNFRFHPDDCILPNETLPLEISRGCIFKCRFCNHIILGRGKLDYLRSFEIIKEEIIYNYENWGTTSYYIICDTFNDTVEKMTEWHKMVSSLPFKIMYTAYLRADLLDKNEDVPYMLQETGLVGCFHGVESLNRTSALAVGKGWSGTRAREYIPKLYHDIWKKQVGQTLSFIAGLPGDTREHNLDVVDWFKQNDLFHMLINPLGLTKSKIIKNLSEFERNAEKYGYSFDETTDPYDYGVWRNDYWTRDEARDFVNHEIIPKIIPTNAKIGSWQMLYHLGLTTDKESLLKRMLNKEVRHINDNRPLVAYKQLLLQVSTS